MSGPKNAPRAGTLAVPGANLYYEVRGSGPVLLMIVGGNGDAGTFGQAADLLADRFTVVSYDRRGFDRSPLDGPVDDEKRLAADADDAHRLLAHLTERPGYVFGSSSGAIVALDFLSRYPGQAARVVAHEPPAVTLLPDGERYLALFDEVYGIYRRDGLEPAMNRFAAEIGIGGLERAAGEAELPPHLAEMMARIRRNMEFWLEHELRPYPRFVPDLAALRAAGTRLVLAGGRDSQQQMPFRPNLVLAERLGTAVAHFPGGHVSYLTHPAEFAERLAAVLAG